MNVCDLIDYRIMSTTLYMACDHDERKIFEMFCTMSLNQCMER